MSTLHYDPIFASIDIDLHLERVGGGNETEVYCTDDRRYVVKVKSDQAGSVAEMLAQARLLRRAARRFATVVGPAHSIPNYFLINRNGTIALSNPDRPSGKNVRKQINEALESRSR